MSESNGVFKMSDKALRQEIFSAVYGMLIAFRTKDGLKNLNDDQIKEMCEKYALKYVEALIEKSRQSNREKLQ